MAPAALAEDSIRRVLLLGDDLALPASLQQVQALRAGLLGRPDRAVEIYQESLDVVRFTSAEEAQAALLRAKFEDVPLDAVVTFGPQALTFAMDHRDALPNGAPIVFFSVMQDTIERSDPDHQLTGLTIPFDLEGTLDLALRLHPNRSRVAVIAGTSRYDLGWLDRAKRLFARRGIGPVSFLNVESVASLLDDVAHLPSDTVVLYLTVTADASGARTISRDVVERVAAASSAPVYSLFESNLGYGVVGGSVVDFAKHGKAAADLVWRVLDGETSSFGRHESAPAARCLLDARALGRWRIAPPAVPRTCEVAFREPSLWQRFGWYVVAALAIIAAQAALITGLLIQRRRSREAEIELSHERAVAAQAARLATLGELSASIAHEIGQPLGAMLSNASAGTMLIQTGGRLDELAPILHDIKRDSLRARDVVRRVRALAQHHSLELQPLDINDVLVDAHRLMEVDANRRDVSLEFDLGRVPPVRGDRVQLQQVLINLMLNAMDAMAALPRSQRRVQLRTRQDDQAVVVSVSDFGPGIPAEHEGRLFESFFTTKSQGVGLGLSIVKSIVEAHEGRIRATNRTDGATFTFTLPVIEESRAKEPPAIDVRPAEARP